MSNIVLYRPMIIPDYDSPCVDFEILDRHHVFIKEMRAVYNVNE